MSQTTSLIDSRKRRWVKGYRSMWAGSRGSIGRIDRVDRRS